MAKEVRDVSAFFKRLREFLLGRKHNLHGRFPPYMAPRTISSPDIPRCPDYKYSNQYYHDRNIFHSVHPPIVAPVAEGPPIKKDGPGPLKPDAICFNTPPTPGPSWWWDGHRYYECVDDPTPKPKKKTQTQTQTDRHMPTCPPSSKK